MAKSPHHGGTSTKEKPEKQPEKKKKDSPEPKEHAPAPGAGNQTSYGFDDGSSITEPLQQPEDTSGEDIQDLLKDAGVQVLAVEWVYQKITGTTLTQQFIEPLTGDFSKMTANATAWRNISETMKAFSTVMTENEKVLGEHWHGPAALAHKAYVDLGWKAGLAAEAGIAELIAKGFDLLAETSKKLAAKALDLLKQLIDKLLRMAAEACIPVAGWVADAIEGVATLIPLIDALIAIVDMIKDIVEKVGDLWNSLKDIGSQLAKIKDVQSVGDLVGIGKNIAGDVGDIRDDAKSISGSVGDIKDRAKEGVQEARDVRTKYAEDREKHSKHPASGRISGTID
ncbi:hypothetical protein ABJI51_37060 [Amycolatopsis sp. NEAU-NG30]|uniref:WXG100 family type VII secretion target n=1 Tax=Amycolatopsis melonis TaxID=3156488 RepID=A0ABV0LQZ0_9PSEU